MTGSRTYYRRSKKPKHFYDQNDGKPGVVYILRNPAFAPDWLKIGQTTKSGQERAEQINFDAGTGIPKHYSCVFESKTIDCGRAEKEVHRILAEYRRGPQEFFEVNIEVAKQVIVETCARFNQAGGHQVDRGGRKPSEENPPAVAERASWHADSPGSSAAMARPTIDDQSKAFQKDKLSERTREMRARRDAILAGRPGINTAPGTKSKGPEVPAVGGPSSEKPQSDARAPEVRVYARRLAEQADEARINHFSQVADSSGAPGAAVVNGEYVWHDPVLAQKSSSHSRSRRFRPFLLAAVALVVVSAGWNWISSGDKSGSSTAATGSKGLQASPPARRSPSSAEVARARQKATDTAAAKAAQDYPYLATAKGDLARKLIVAERDRRIASGTEPVEALRQAVALIAPKYGPPASKEPARSLRKFEGG